MPFLLIGTGNWLDTDTMLNPRFVLVAAHHMFQILMRQPVRLGYLLRIVLKCIDVPVLYLQFARLPLHLSPAALGQRLALFGLGLRRLERGSRQRLVIARTIQILD